MAGGDRRGGGRGRGSISPYCLASPSLSVPSGEPSRAGGLCRPRFLLSGGFSPPLCCHAPSAASWRLVTRERLIGLMGAFVFTLGNKASKSLAVKLQAWPSPPPSQPPVYMSHHPEAPKGWGPRGEGAPCRGGRAPEPSTGFSGAASLPPFKAVRGQWLGSEWKGPNESPQGSRESERAAATAARSEGTGFWKSSDRAGAPAWSIPSPLCWELARLGPP